MKYIAACYTIPLTLSVGSTSAYIGSDLKSKRGGPLRKDVFSGSVMANGAISTFDWSPQSCGLVADLPLL